eukprot:m.21512 g.21512  ORF g.21512 m.21512 type:complete len:563 (-) comp7171_c0_seq1:194-1882(-)
MIFAEMWVVIVTLVGLLAGLGVKSEPPLPYTNCHANFTQRSDNLYLLQYVGYLKGLTVQHFRNGSWVSLGSVLLAGYGSYSRNGVLPLENGCQMFQLNRGAVGFKTKEEDWVNYNEEPLGQLVIKNGTAQAISAHTLIHDDGFLYTNKRVDPDQFVEFFKWNGTDWMQLATSEFGNCDSLVSYGGSIYQVGTTKIQRYDAKKDVWEAVLRESTGACESAVFDNKIYFHPLGLSKFLDTWTPSKGHEYGAFALNYARLHPTLLNYQGCLYCFGGGYSEIRGSTGWTGERLCPGYKAWQMLPEQLVYPHYKGIASFPIVISTTTSSISTSSITISTLTSGTSSTLTSVTSKSTVTSSSISTSSISSSSTSLSKFTVSTTTAFTTSETTTTFTVIKSVANMKTTKMTDSGEKKSSSSAVIIIVVIVIILVACLLLIVLYRRRHQSQNSDARDTSSRNNRTQATTNPIFSGNVIDGEERYSNVEESYSSLEHERTTYGTETEKLDYFGLGSTPGYEAPVAYNENQYEPIEYNQYETPVEYNEYETPIEHGYDTAQQKPEVYEDIDI